jgi:hypothetical protein
MKLIIARQLELVIMFVFWTRPLVAEPFAEEIKKFSRINK